MVQNFDWEIVQKIIKYASEWLKMVENGLKHLKMVQNVSNAWKCSKKNNKTKLVKI